MRGISIVAALVLVSRESWASTQDLSDTSGWALHGNQTCPRGDSTCGQTFGYFVACCPPTSPCLTQYHDVCCPPNQNCTDALIASGPRCGDPTWTLCLNNGCYFCCLPGQTCYTADGIDGCADPGYEFAQGEIALNKIDQVQRSAAATSTSTSPSPSPSTSATPSPTVTAQTLSSGLSTSDKIAIGIGVPVGVATILSTWIAWKLYQKKQKKAAISPIQADAK